MCRPSGIVFAVAASLFMAAFGSSFSENERGLERAPRNSGNENWRQRVELGCKTDRGGLLACLRAPAEFTNLAQSVPSGAATSASHIYASEP